MLEYQDAHSRRGFQTPRVSHNSTSSTHTGVDSRAAFMHLQSKLHQHFTLQGDSTYREFNLYHKIGLKKKIKKKHLL